MTDRNPDDISIGKDRWLPILPIDHQAECFEIDPLLEPTMLFWESLESECVAECCGINAFCFWPENIVESIGNSANEQIIPQLLDLQESVRNVSAATILCKRFNEYFHRSVFVNLVDHVGQVAKAIKNHSPKIKAQIHWQRFGETFTDHQYSRAHEWKFDGGQRIVASSSPSVVPTSDPTAVDPEEAFVASLSSCHMLWFLAIAAKRGFVVESYSDDAIGDLAKNENGKQAMTVVTLYPLVRFASETLPTKDQFETMHHEAHKECFIANSVLTEVKCEPKIIGT